MVTDPALWELIIKVCGSTRPLQQGFAEEHTGHADSQILTRRFNPMFSLGCFAEGLECARPGEEGRVPSGWTSCRFMSVLVQVMVRWGVLCAPCALTKTDELCVCQFRPR